MIQLPCQPIRAPDQIPDRFYVISIEFLSLRHRRLSWLNVPSSQEGGRVAVFKARKLWQLIEVMATRTPCASGNREKK